MRYRYDDGYEFEANGPMEIATALWQSKFVPEDTLEEWMAGFANRCKMWDGTILRTDSVENLVNDLLTCGQLVPIS